MDKKKKQEFTKLYVARDYQGLSNLLEESSYEEYQAYYQLINEIRAGFEKYNKDIALAEELKLEKELESKEEK